MRICSLLQHNFVIYADKTAIFFSQCSLKRRILMGKRRQQQLQLTLYAYITRLHRGESMKSIKLPKEVAYNITFYSASSPNVNEVQQETSPQRWQRINKA